MKKIYIKDREVPTIKTTKKKGVPAAKPCQEEKPNYRHQRFKGLNWKEQLLLAEYGPDAIENPTFPFVLQIARCRSPKANNFGFDYTLTPKDELLKELLKALDTGDGELFRKLASAAESVARVEKGIYYNPIARELLLSDRKEGYAVKGQWGSEFVTRKDILLRAHRKVEDGVNDGQYRNLDRLKRVLDIELGKAKRGRPKKKIRRGNSR